MADLASVEQRLDRQRRAAKSGDKEIVAEVAALEQAHAVLSDGTPHRARRRSPPTIWRGSRRCSASRPSRCWSSPTPARRSTTDGALPDGDDASRCRSTSRPRSRRARPKTAPRCARSYGARRVRARHGRAGRVPPARPAHVPHDRRRRVARVDVPRRRQGARVRGRDPQRPAARVHPGRGDRLARAARDRLVGEGARGRASCASRARTTRCGTATCSRSGSTCSAQGRRDALAGTRRRRAGGRPRSRSRARCGAAGSSGRDDLDGVLVLRPCRQVHTFGMRFPIDVAFCDRYGFVLHVSRLRPRPGLALRVSHAYFAIEARGRELRPVEDRPRRRRRDQG